MGNKLLLRWTKLFIELTLIEMLKGKVEKDDGVKLKRVYTIQFLLI